MNDFTKEELITLMKAIHKCSEMTDWPEEAYAVANKIESMIEARSCEHEWHISNDTIKVEHRKKIFDYRPTIIKCKLCGKSYFS